MHFPLDGPVRPARSSSATANGSSIPNAPKVDCIGKGKAAAPYELGVQASSVINNRRTPGDLSVLYAGSLPDNPYDGHTLRAVIDHP